MSRLPETRAGRTVEVEVKTKNGEAGLSWLSGLSPLASGSCFNPGEMIAVGMVSGSCFNPGEMIAFGMASGSCLNPGEMMTVGVAISVESQPAINGAGA